MKDRTREAVMNLLGGTLSECVVFDLFAGTGVLGFEALSRGGVAAVFFEILKTAAKDIAQNANVLNVQESVVVVSNDVIRWSDSLARNLEMLELPELPWVVFCCPPYALWDSQGEVLRTMLLNWIELAPQGSLFAIELEEKTSLDCLPSQIEWDIRTYRPAQMAIGEK
jgi:16S rRNA (guanine966-N2)-methyltransferase